jgi:prevent-host-death family protein
MRTVAAIEVRKRFGEIVDQAAAGERIVIERAGHPVAAIVPLSDLAMVDPDEKRKRQLAAIEEIRRRAKRHHAQPGESAAELIRRQRDERTAHILQVREAADRARDSR